MINYKPSPESRQHCSCSICEQSWGASLLCFSWPFSENELSFYTLLKLLECLSKLSLSEREFYVKYITHPTRSTIKKKTRKMYY